MAEKKIDVLYDTEVTCPVCGEKISVTKTRSKMLRFIKRDPDNCPYYEGINPIFYTAYVCSECGYSALERHFENVTESGKAEVMNKITPKWKKRKFTGRRDVHAAIEVHRLVLLNYTIMHVPFSELGKLCLKIAWLYRYLEDPKEMDYLQHTYDLFEKAYTSEPLDENPKNEVNVLFLMGEVARQLENYRKSVEWLGMALQSEGMKGNKALERVTRDQWADAKATYSKMRKAEGN